MLSHTGGRDAESKREIEGQGRGASKRFVRVLPVNEVKVFLQVSGVNVALAELQLSAGVVVDVVNAHLLHDAKTSLRRRRHSDGDGGGRQMQVYMRGKEEGRDWMEIRKGDTAKLSSC